MKLGKLSFQFKKRSPSDMPVNPSQNPEPMYTYPMIRCACTAGSMQFKTRNVGLLQRRVVHVQSTAFNVTNINKRPMDHTTHLEQRYPCISVPNI